MVINSNNVQNVKFLRNGTLFGTRDAAKAALEEKKSLGLDGSAILARYSTNGVPAVKTLVGFIYKDNSTTSVTVFDVDDAGTDAKAYVVSLVGTGVTTANTVTQQLQVLSGDSATAGSGDTSVAGAKKYTDGKLDALDLATVTEAGKPIIAVKQEDGLVSASVGTIDAESVNYAGTTAHTATTVEAAIDYLYETIDNFEDFKDTPVAGQYVSEVSFVDGRPQISRVALPNATTVADDNKIVSDVTQTNGQITATAKNLTAVKLGGYAEGTDADIAATDTLGEALGKLQAQINAMDLSAVGTEGSVITSVSEDDGKVSATATPVKDVKLTGYVKDTAKTGDIAATDDIEDALSKLENKAAAITIANADGSINVTTGATGTDISVNIKSGEKVLAKDGNAGVYTDLDIVKITSGLPETVKERYQLLATDDSQIGVNIDVPKDSHIVSITYDETTQKLIYKYIDASGVEQTTEVDMAHLILETEVENGIQSVNGKLSIKLDTTGDDTGDGKFLTVGANGLKLDGVTDAISTAISGLDFTTDAAVAGQYVAAIEETDGVVAVKTRANVSEAVLNNYTKGSDATAVAATDTVNQAISKLENQVDAVDGLVDALSAKTFTVATSSNASITTATAATADGTVSVDLITDADKIKMSGFTNATSLSAITKDDSIATAFEKAASAIDDAKAASTTEVVEGTDAGNNMTIASATSQTDGHVTYTINLTDVASDAALTAEIAARKAVDGQNGDTYAANSSANYISNATSLNDADVKLDTALKALSDGTVNEVQVNGVTLSAETSNAVNVKISSAPASGTIASPIVVNTDESTGEVKLQILQIDCGEY